MLSIMLKAKLHMLRVTSAELDYEGSLAIDRDFMDAVGFREYEKILVANRENGARFETYAIEAPRGSKTVCLNGATAHLGKKGDRIIIFTFCHLTDDEMAAHVPKVAIFNAQNEIIRLGHI